MSSSMDKSHSAPASSPGYETRDANVRAVFGFLVILGVVLVLSAIVCWGLFNHYSVKDANRTPLSPFSATRQLPTGPQLQVNPRQELLTFRSRQEQSLESYSWESREDGTVRVPIERAMEMLLKQGLPVAPGASSTEASPQGEKPASPESEKH